MEYDFGMAFVTWFHYISLRGGNDEYEGRNEQGLGLIT